MKKAAFLSSTFNEKDQPVVEKFKKILIDLHVESYQAYFVPEIFHDIITKIKNLDLFVCIFTPDDDGRVRDWVKKELSSALALHKHVIIFREDSLPVQKEYEDRNQIEFCREALLLNEKDEIDKIKNVIIEHCRMYGYDFNESDIELDRRLEFAKKQACIVGSHILAFYNDAFEKALVRDFAVKNFPTDADRKANRMVIDAIESDSITSRDGIISEESSNSPQTISQKIREQEFVWIIDPLDGTLNFAYGFPYFCISIGLLREGKPVMGVVYNPTTQEMYYGRKGMDSECLDLTKGIRRPLCLHSTKNDLSDCILMTHISTRPEPRKITHSVLEELSSACRAIRVLGSGSMSLVSLSLGQFDLFFNYSTYIWDIVPGVVLLQGAGGYISSSLESHTWDWSSHGIIAAVNPNVGEKLRNLLNRKLSMDFPKLI